MFKIITLPVYVDRDESENIIGSGVYPNWNCQDWQCPSRNICGRHFGLSKRYAAMSEMGADDALCIPHRGGDKCDHYTDATFDHFAASLGETGFMSRGGSA